MSNWEESWDCQMENLIIQRPHNEPMKWMSSLNLFSHCLLLFEKFALSFSEINWKKEEFWKQIIIYIFSHQNHEMTFLMTTLTHAGGDALRLGTIINSLWSDWPKNNFETNAKVMHCTIAESGRLCWRLKWTVNPLSLAAVKSSQTTLEKSYAIFFLF